MAPNKIWPRTTWSPLASTRTSPRINTSLSKRPKPMETMHYCWCCYDACTYCTAEIQRRLRRQAPSSPSSDVETEALPSKPRVSLKWPNDVLLGGAKVAGVLIEAELPFLLVGIGVNVRHKPDVPQQGPDRGRPAACLGDFGADSSDEVGKVAFL